MGRTIPTASQNLRMEKQDWKLFRDQLPKSERKLFDEMFDMADLNRMAMMASIPSHPVRIQPIMMSLVFHHYKQLARISDKHEKQYGQGPVDKAP